METPSSIRRSQASVTSQKGKKDDSSFSRSRTNGNPERSALLDITNDSPIVGLASEKTPSSSAVKNRVQAMKNTPGSGEALLRGQVKTLLQKVEEEAEFVNGKLSSGDRPPFRVVLGLPGPSPLQLLAPTPANTPQIIIEQDGIKIAPIQVAEAVKPEEEEECLINRALLFDSPEKSDVTDVSSSLSYQGSEIRSYPEKSPGDDSSSGWSLQVNVSSIQDDEDEEEGEEIGDLEVEEEEEEEEDYEEEAEDYDDGSFDDLCEGLSKMTVEDKFEGKHTRFVYNSDGEIEGEEVIGGEKKKNASPSKVVLKGLPAPEGKHLRFHDEEEDQE